MGRNALSAGFRQKIPISKTGFFDSECDDRVSSNVHLSHGMAICCLKSAICTAYVQKSGQIYSTPSGGPRDQYLPPPRTQCALWLWVPFLDLPVCNVFLQRTYPKVLKWLLAVSGTPLPSDGCSRLAFLWSEYHLLPCLSSVQVSTRMPKLQKLVITQAVYFAVMFRILLAVKGPELHTIKFGGWLCGSATRMERSLLASLMKTEQDLAVESKKAKG